MTQPPVVRAHILNAPQKLLRHSVETCASNFLLLSSEQKRPAPHMTPNPAPFLPCFVHSAAQTRESHGFFLSGSLLGRSGASIWYNSGRRCIRIVSFRSLRISGNSVGWYSGK
jgi:hypothetical protein